MLNGQEVLIKKYKVEVKYLAVDTLIEKIWDETSDLVIHVGVHGKCDKIQIEKCAMNGFTNKDYAEKKLSDPFLCLPNSGRCVKLETNFDVEKIVNFLNQNYKPIFAVSCDAGSYLCAYLYLKSLDKNPSTLFVHVPCIDKPFSSEETSRAILKIIEYLLLEKIDQK